MRQTLLWLSAVLCLLTSGLVQALSLEQIQEKGSLRVAVYKDFPPYSYSEGGKLKGIDVEIGAALAQQLGVDVDYMLVVADENMDDDLRNAIWKGHYLGGGTADVMLRVPYDLAYAAKNEQVLFFAPYAHENIVLLYDSEKIPSVINLQVLQHHKVGAEVDSVGSFYLSSIFNGQLTDSLQHYIDFKEAIAAFEAGELAAVIGMRGQIEGDLAEQKPHWQLAPVQMRGLKSEWDVGLAVKQDYQALAEQLSAAMTQLRENGELTKIFAQYGMSYAAPLQK
jgi:ABC-type amino acid transport substrate-binding protein